MSVPKIPESTGHYELLVLVGRSIIPGEREANVNGTRLTFDRVLKKTECKKKSNVDRSSEKHGVKL